MSENSGDLLERFGKLANGLGGNLPGAPGNFGKLANGLGGNLPGAPGNFGKLANGLGGTCQALSTQLSKPVSLFYSTPQTPLKAVRSQHA